MPLRVIDVSLVDCNIFSVTVHTNTSSSEFHLKPRVFSVGNRSPFKLTTHLARSDLGTDANTFSPLLNYFVRQNPPLCSNSLSWRTSLMAFSVISVDLSRSSTYMFRFTVSVVTSSNSLQFNSDVFRKQKLATLGDDVAPKRCLTIRYSSNSLERSVFGHQRNLNTSRSFGSTNT